MAKEKRILVAFQEKQFNKAIELIENKHLNQLNNVLDAYKIHDQKFTNDLLQEFYTSDLDAFLTAHNDLRSVWVRVDKFLMVDKESYKEINTKNAYQFDEVAESFILLNSYINELKNEVFSLYAVGQDIEVMKSFDEVYKFIDKHYELFSLLKKQQEYYIDDFTLLRMFKNRSLFCGVSEKIYNE